MIRDYGELKTAFRSCATRNHTAMKTFLLVALLFSVTAAQKCITSQLLAATSVFEQKLGMDTTGIWKNYTVLNNFLLQQWGANAGSTDPIFKSCNALDVFYSSLYPNGGYYCFSLQNMVNGGASPADAYAIIGTLEQYQFNCGAGFITLLHENMKCVQSVINGYFNTLKACTATYQTNIQNDPASACQYIEDYENCYALPFSSSICRSRAQTADVWWGCENARVFAHNHALTCKNSCDLRHGPRNHEEYAATHHKEVAGVKMYKLPVLVQKIDGKLVRTEGEWMNN